MATVVTATYVDASAKVTVAVSGATGYASGTYCTFQRSTDGITWTTVRGGATIALTGGVASLDDYEFADRVVNTYRVLFVYPATPAFQGASAIATTTSAGATVSTTPGAWPVSTQVGTLILAFVACTKSTATLNIPAGWTQVAISGTNTAIYAALWTASLILPTFTASAVASGDILTVKLEGYFNASATPATQLVQANASSQNINYPSVTAPPLGYIDGVLWAYKPSVNTGSTPAPSINDTATGWTSILFNDLLGSLASGTLTLTGGAAAVSVAFVLYFATAASIDQVSATVTPALSQPWIVNPLRPYLNRAIVTVGVADSTRDARTGVFPVIARTLPVAVTDLQAGRATTITVRCATRALTDDLESCLLTGEVVFIHGPAGAVTPTWYAAIGQITRTRPAATGITRYLVLPLVEVAAPDAGLAATLSTWQTVINQYAAWSALVAAEATWTAVLTVVGTSADVVTG